MNHGYERRFFFAPDGDGGGGTGEGGEAGEGNGAGAGETLLAGSGGSGDPASSGEGGTGEEAAGGTALPFHRGLYGEDGKINQANLENLPEELKPYKDTFKKYPTIDGLFGALGNAQTLIGKKGLMPLPADASDEVKAEHHERLREVLGVPEKPEGYAIQKPDNVPDDVWDPEAVSEAQVIAHKHNLSPEGMRELVQWDADRALKLAEAQEAKVQEGITQAKKDLETEFGADTERRRLQAQSLAKQVGIDIHDPILGNRADIISGLAKVAALLGEDKIGLPEGAGSGNESPAAQARDIMVNPSNPLHEAYRSTGHPNHKSVLAKVVELSKLGSK